MSKYPIYLELRDRRVVIVGAGAVAARKVKALFETGARLVIISPKIDAMLSVSLQATNVEIIKSHYEKSYLAGAILVIAATDDQPLNKQIYKDCQELEILCNVVDQPQLCDFFVPAIVKRGNLQIAIATEGNCPAFAGHIRDKLEKILTEEHGAFLAVLEKMRLKIIDVVTDQNERKVILSQLVNDESFEYFKQNGSDKWIARAEQILNQHQNS
jgi:precorrin-2 dehydrogenase/sirohydrochlorin ferrochelatase